MIFLLVVLPLLRVRLVYPKKISFYPKRAVNTHTGWSLTSKNSIKLSIILTPSLCLLNILELSKCHFHNLHEYDYWKISKRFFRLLRSWEIQKTFAWPFFLPTLYLPYFQPHQCFCRLTGMFFSYANTTRWSWWWITITFWYKPDTIDGHARPAILQYFYTTQNILTLIFYAINQAKKGSKILVFFLHIQLHFFNAELTFSICSKMNFTITSSEIK